MDRIVIVLVVVCLAFGNADNLCSWINDEETHLRCTDGFVFPVENFGNNIRTLTVHSKSVKSLKSEDFENFSNLTHIDLSDSNITDIDSGAFVNNKHLKTIDLSHNKDLIIPENAPLFHSETLRQLILRDTGISTLPDNAFEGLPSLEILNLEENKIQDIEKALENANQIQKLMIHKDDNINVELLCERTSLKLIETKIIDDDGKEVPVIHNCVQDPDTDKETPTENETHTDNEKHSEKEKQSEKEISTEKEKSTDKDKSTEKPTEIVTTEKNIEKIDNSTILEDNSQQNDTKIEMEKTKIHETFCKDQDNLGFNGNISCKPEDDKNVCELSCTDGMKPEENFENPYICLYSEGVFSPKKIPKCTAAIASVEEKTEQKEKGNEETPVEKEEKQEEENTEKVDDIHINEITKDEIDTRANLELADGDEKLGESKSDGGVNGSSVVLGVIIVVLVLGALGMGYKYWKNHRGYQNTRTEDVEEGKELKTISSNNKPLVEQND